MTLKTVIINMFKDFKTSIIRMDTLKRTHVEILKLKIQNMKRKKFTGWA